MYLRLQSLLCLLLLSDIFILDEIPPKYLKVIISNKVYSDMKEANLVNEDIVSGKYVVQVEELDNHPHWINENNLIAIWKLSDHKWAFGHVKDKGTRVGILAGPCHDDSFWPKTANGKGWEHGTKTEDGELTLKDVGNGDLVIKQVFWFHLLLPSLLYINRVNRMTKND